MSQVILILSDALRYDTAVYGMGFLGHLVEYRRASLYKIIGELPSMSRPMYETIHTGVPVIEHGVVSNAIVRLSNQPNIFGLAVKVGKTTAAAAYCWVSELYNRAPYDPVEDREVDDLSLPIQHGRFYSRDEYPDQELIYDAALLVRRFNPDYLLLHPMGMDYFGETYGSDSREYLINAVRQDVWLAPFLTEWMERGYTILITGDHGINANRFHGGPAPEMRNVPLFMIRPGIQGAGDTGETISHLQIAPTVCVLLGIPIPSTMKAPPLV